MKKSLYICNATNPKGLQTYYKYDFKRILWSTSVTRWVCRKTIQGVRSLFVHNAQLVRQMRQTNKQAMKAKNSNLYAPIWKGQAIYSGWLTITRTFTNKADAVAWYDKHQEGWRYRHAVAVLWQGCKAGTRKKHLKDALVGGDAWAIAKAGNITCQAQYDNFIYELC